MSDGVAAPGRGETGFMEELRIEIKRLRAAPPGLALPAYMSAGAAGMDLCADLDRPIEIAPLARALIPTGIAIALPAGFEAQIRPRSGLALRQGLTLLNSPGTIDPDYRGELRVIVQKQEPLTRLHHRSVRGFPRRSQPQYLACRGIEREELAGS